jgi:hypothetical protein
VDWQWTLFLIIFNKTLQIHCTAAEGFLRPFGTKSFMFSDARRCDKEAGSRMAPGDRGIMKIACPERVQRFLFSLHFFEVQRNFCRGGVGRFRFLLHFFFFSALGLNARSLTLGEQPYMSEPITVIIDA